MNVKELEYTETDYGDTKLILELEGKEINYTLLNSLRKISINQVPIYAFDATQINIIKNTSIYDGIYMRCRLSQLPITNIDCNICYLEQKYYKDIDFNDYDKHPEDIVEIEYFINSKNNENKMILDVTTDNIIMKINGKIIKNNLKVPILLIKLRPNEEFECSMKGVLSIGKHNSIFDSCNCYYDQIADDKYILILESIGQNSEYRLLQKVCDLLIIKLKIIEDNIKNNEKNIKISDENTLVIDFENENYTTIGMVNYLLQCSEKNVEYSGITMYDGFLQNNIRLRLKTKKGISPFLELYKSINNSVNIFNDFKSKIKNKK